MLRKLTKKTFKVFSQSPQDLNHPADFEAIYNEYKEFIRTVIYWMIRDENVDDLVQETFKKAWISRASFKNESTIKTWLYRIAMNASKDFIRHKIATNGASSQLEDLESEVLDPEKSAELKELIDIGLNALSVEQKELFILFYKLSFTQKEIADLLGIPLGTVKSQLFHCREKFSKAIEKKQVSYA